MNEKILIKKVNTNTEKELESINFSAEYIKNAEKKFNSVCLKIFNLKPAEANILKQTCLSLGFDAAINRDAVTCKCEKSDALICGSLYQFSKLCSKLEQQLFRLKNLSSEIKNSLYPPKNYYISGKEFDFDETYFMGILNVTPDSFSDGGNNFDTEKAVKYAEEMYNCGAKIIDVGGESTNPTAIPISHEEECSRILPVIKKLKTEHPEIIVSVDTIHPETVVRAVDNGADILNNVDCIEKFEPVFDFLKEHETPIVLTHSLGVPPKPVDKDFDGDIVEHIFKFFAQKINYIKSSGLEKNLIILDAGIGFGKSVNDQFELVKRADEFFTLGCPVLFGISRKSFISKTFGTENRDEITKIYSQYLIEKKINILRVHDVKTHINLKKYLDKLL